MSDIQHRVGQFDTLLVRNFQSPNSATLNGVDSGTYTPTITDMASRITTVGSLVLEFRYARIGKIVLVNGIIDNFQTNGGAASGVDFQIGLPTQYPLQTYLNDVKGAFNVSAFGTASGPTITITTVTANTTYFQLTGTQSNAFGPTGNFSFSAQYLTSA